MAFGWSGAGAGASDALQKLLAERMMEQYRQATVAQNQQQIDQRATEEANQQARAVEQLAMQQKQFAAAETERGEDRAYRGRQEDVASADRRQVQNQRGVRSKVLEGLRTKTTTPRTAQLMAAGEGVEIEPDVLDPEKSQRDKIAQIQETGRQGRMTAGVRASQPSAGDYATFVDQKGNFRQVTKGPEANALLAQGWKPHDAVLARQAANASTDAVKGRAYEQDVAKSIVTELDRLMEAGAKPGEWKLKSGTKSVTGTGRVPAPVARLALPFMGGAADAIAAVDKLVATLDVDTIREMKSQSRTGATGFGQLSEKELLVLENAASMLRTAQSERQFLDRLTEIRTAAEKVQSFKPPDDGGDDDDALIKELLGR